MASPLSYRFARLCRNIGVFPRTAVCESSGTVRTQYRTAVCTSSGAILPKPKKTVFGMLRIIVVVVPFLYIGTQISKNFAALLEEHDIFVPEDDDDDD
ncbi:essential MCU regulator, mitochondrial-like [Tachysurus fulvidraco]|uniref:essential MCU regulator, mitochondrial-like n=1 Tax=Tachysurus fulvidraco TaxID=1234273 RepID=UPI000F4D6F4B|nr:essential MCU regulator, mitochondrial-like [Tachysurus fulvidraco]XP_027032069.1 essential MCU regulator, mitochondrial-like [Tachysurus fulvidraco]XP_047672236.1 essential MCU regulator, mitochondrial-like [Tachysurus fulvidraco]